MLGITGALVVLAVGWIAAYAAEALGQRPLGGMVRLAAIFGAAVELVGVMEGVVAWVTRVAERIDRVIHLGGIIR